MLDPVGRDGPGDGRVEALGVGKEGSAGGRA
jgi:hypothetical protein